MQMVMDNKYFRDRLPKLPFSSSYTLMDVREILDILDKHNDEGKVQRMEIVIPENATNGDMFKALFPNYTYVGVCVLDENECILLHDVNYHWWNAPYEAEREVPDERKTESKKV